MSVMVVFIVVLFSGNRPMGGGNRGPRPNGPRRPRRDDRRDDE